MPGLKMGVRQWLLAGAVVGLTACQGTVQPSATSTVAVAPTATALPAAAAAVPPAGATRVEMLNAANTAFQRGDLNTAAGLYDRVANTPPTAGESAAAAAAIDQFARFRGLITLLADGREDEARAYLAELQSRDPNSPLAKLGAQLYDQYGMTGQLRGACAQVQPQLTTVAAPTLQALQSLGVMVDAATLCSVP